MGILSTITGLIPTAVNYFSNRAANNQNQANFERSLQHQQIMWDKNNAYNAPSAVMSRLNAAGLSPHLVYGSGGVTPSNMPSLPSPPSKTAFSMDPLTFATLQTTMAQKSLLKSQDAKTKAETDAIYSDIELKMRADSRAEEAEIRAWNEENRASEQHFYTLASIDAGIQKAEAEINLLRQSLGHNSKLYPLVLDYQQAVNDLQQLEINNLTIDNRFRAALNAASLARSYQEIENLKVKYKLDDQEFGFLQKVNNVRVLGEELDYNFNKFNFDYSQLSPDIGKTRAWLRNSDFGQFWSWLANDFVGPVVGAVNSASKFVNPAK